MISRLKLLFLVNWRENGNWSLILDLRKFVSEVDFLQPVTFKSSLFGRLNPLSTYLSEFYLPALALFRKKRFDVVISWQIRIGVCYGILKGLFSRGKPPLHVIQDFHVDLSQRSGINRLKIALLKMAIPGIDYFFCTSTEEEEIYSRMFKIPRERIMFLPLTEAEATFQHPSCPSGNYIFSFGKSDRDYDTLVRAAARVKMPIYILSSKYKPRVPLPENVSIMRDYLSPEELLRWLAQSRLVVLPLKDYRVSAGQISMLEVMALGRPLIITENMATKEYGIHGQSVLFFPAGDDIQLAKKIMYLWDNEEIAEQIGKNARLSAATLDQKRWDVFKRLLECCAQVLKKGEGQ